MTEASEHWGVGLTNLSSGYRVCSPLNIFQSKLPALLKRFIITIDGIYKINLVDVLRYLFLNVFDSE